MCKTCFDSQGMIQNGAYKNLFSEYVNGVRDPPPLHSKYHFEIPFCFLNLSLIVCVLSTIDHL